MIRVYLATQGVRFIKTEQEMPLREVLKEASIDVPDTEEQLRQGQLEILIDSKQVKDLDQMVGPDSVVILAGEVETG